MRIFLIVSLFLTLSPLANCQEEIRESNFIGISFHYGLNRPTADLGDRFGSFFNSGGSIGRFNHKTKSIIGLEAEVLFGENVKENVVENLQLDNNAFLGNDGGYADVFLRMRGTYVGLYYNKVLKSRKELKHAGFAVGLGVGMLQHKIRLNVESLNAPQFEGEYAKGYDRNSIGPALKQSIQYLHIGRYNSPSFAVEFEIMEGFTKNTRPINFDTKLKDDESRLDMNLRLNIKWYLPVKDLKPSEEIYY